MSNPFLSPPRRWPRLAIGIAALLLVGVAAGLVVEQALFPPPPSPTGVPTPAPLPGASTDSAEATATATPPTSHAAMPSAGPVKLVRGRRLVAGMYLGYPHSVRGAVSAAAEYMTQICSTLDPDRSAAVLRLAADPSYPDGPAQFAQGTIGNRGQLGLPTSGPAPRGASVALVPVDYQLRDVSAGRVTVLLLADYTTTLPTGSRTRIGVFPLRLHWATSDWRILRPEPSADYTALAAQPGSVDAVTKGWQAITR